MPEVSPYVDTPGKVLVRLDYALYGCNLRVVTFNIVTER